MNIAIVLYDRFTALDAIGPYEVLSRLPGARRHVRRRRARARCAPTTACSRCSPSARSRRPERPTSCSCPAAPARSPRAPAARCSSGCADADRTSTWTTVGLHRLADPRRRRTARRQARDQPLAGARGARRLGAEPVHERVVFDGKLVTAAGVSAGIDMALTLAARVAGDTVAQAIQLGIEYDPQPPFDAGSPRQGARARSSSCCAPAAASRSSRRRRPPHHGDLSGARPPRSVPGRPLTCDHRWQITATTRTRSSPAGRRCGRASAPGRSQRDLRGRARGTRIEGARRRLPRGRPGSQLLRARDAPVPQRRAPHRPSEVLLGRRRDRPLPPAPGRARAAPDGLRRLRPAGREPRDQDRRAPARLDRRVDRLLPAPVPLVGNLDRLVARARHRTNRPTTAGRSGSSWSCSAPASPTARRPRSSGAPTTRPCSPTSRSTPTATASAAARSSKSSSSSSGSCASPTTPSGC